MQIFHWNMQSLIKSLKLSCCLGNNIWDICMHVCQTSVWKQQQNYRLQSENHHSHNTDEVHWPVLRDHLTKSPSFSLTCPAEKRQPVPTTQRRATASLEVMRRRHRVCGGRSSDGKKRQRDGCGSSGQAASRTQQSISPLCAGVKYRKLLLYYSESWPSFLSLLHSLSLSVCVYVEDSLFYGHKHVEEITARIFKETGTFFFLLRNAVTYSVALNL